MEKELEMESGNESRWCYATSRDGRGIELMMMNQFIAYVRESIAAELNYK